MNGAQEQRLWMRVPPEVLIPGKVHSNPGVAFSGSHCPGLLNLRIIIYIVVCNQWR